jgi:hypothetical protein
MVTSFLAATIGLGPLFDATSPLPPNLSQVAWYRGKIQGDLTIDMSQIREGCLVGVITQDLAVKQLCCMLLNTAYAVAEPHNDHSPAFELFRHLRNAASHGNQFFFAPGEPKRPASWAGLTIDHTKKGTQNAYFGMECVGQTISPADAIALLKEIEGHMP